MDRFEAIKHSIEQHDNNPVVEHTGDQLRREIWKGVDLAKQVDIAKAQNEGRLVVLPCNVGDTVYVTNAYTNKKVMKCHVTVLEPVTIWVSSDCESWGGAYTNDDFGKTVFPTLEAAEAALKERE